MTVGCEYQYQLREDALRSKISILDAWMFLVLQVRSKQLNARSILYVSTGNIALCPWPSAERPQGGFTYFCYSDTTADLKSGERRQNGMQHYLLNLCLVYCDLDEDDAMVFV